jgi:hypothetical protein
MILHYSILLAPRLALGSPIPNPSANFDVTEVSLFSQMKVSSSLAPFDSTSPLPSESSLLSSQALIRELSLRSTTFSTLSTSPGTGPERARG